MISFRSLALVAGTGLMALLVGCSGGSALSGKFYENDGPPETSEQVVPDEITPKVERPHKAANRPYTVMGKRYFPMTGDAPFSQTGVASWYGKQFHGRKTAIGERYDMFSLSAAHPTMELPSYARVTNLANGRSVLVRVNDRGPFLGGRAIDMSYAAAMKLGYHKVGTAHVRIERLTRHDIAAGRFSTTVPQESLPEAPLASPAPSEPSQPLALTIAPPETAPAEGTVNLSDPVRETEFATEGATKSSPKASVDEPVSDPIGTLVESQSLSHDSPVVVGTVSPVFPEAPVPGDSVAALLTPQALSTSASIPSWSCQVGAYSNEASAKEFAAHTEMMLSENRLNVLVKVLADDNLYRVLVGSEFDKGRARLLCEKINILLGLKAFLIQR